MADDMRIKWNSERLDEIINNMVSMRSIGSTGVESLDEILGGGIYPEVYILAAEPGAGKTTLMLQIADYIARFGNRRVLFFSLEMSTEAIVAKSLSRISSQGKGEALRVRQLGRPDKLTSSQMDSLNGAVAAYRDEIAANMATIADACTLSDIETYMAAAVSSNECSPAVFIDYLQLIRPENDGMQKTDVQHLTECMNRLCKLCAQYSAPVFVVSSQNRGGQGSGSFKSLNGACAIEYGAHVVMFLSVTGDGETERAENREKLERPVSLSVKKNRNGSLGDISLTFKAAQNTFAEGAL